MISMHAYLRAILEHLMIVRRAGPADINEAARTIAVVAEEDFLGAQPPVAVEWDPAASGSSKTTRAPGRARRDATKYAWRPVDRDRDPARRSQPGRRARADRAVQQRTRAVGAHKISLDVWTDNARAIALYASAGFEVEGLRRDHYRRKDGRAPRHADHGLACEPD
jgi:hypothetical protein